MTGGVFKTVTKRKARIEIIPLIDVIFFLLATFVLFTLSLHKLQSLPVQLPYSGATTNRPLTPPKMVTLQLSEGDTLFWNHEPIVLKDLPALLGQYQQANPNDTRVLITTDDKAIFREAVAVLDQIRLLKIDQVSIDCTRTYKTGR
ncbi:MAG: biopolymer transporter ExbD [Opitutaceae bacterium]|jgi:biopolymer transport protein ExbD